MLERRLSLLPRTFFEPFTHTDGADGRVVTGADPLSAVLTAEEAVKAFDKHEWPPMGNRHLTRVFQLPHGIHLHTLYCGCVSHHIDGQSHGHCIIVVAALGRV